MNQHRLSDPFLFLVVTTLVGIGLVMVMSASLVFAEANHLSPLYFMNRQLMALGIGFGGCIIITFLPMRFWRLMSIPFLLLSFLALGALLVPGVSHPVNGSVRWLFIGPLSIQVSEFAKIALIIYIARFLSEHATEVRTRLSGFIKPTLILAAMAVLLIMEPDFGTVVVIVTTILGMLFLGGVPIRHFLVLGGIALASLAILATTSAYRLTRLSVFLNPWADQFNTGYQLTQSLIAFGRGGWWGMGLGNSVQKLLYLPAPHTDFLFAVLAEELGLLGALTVLFLFVFLIWRIFKVGQRAIKREDYFSGYTAFGIGLWIGIQTIINIGVNIGALPTKGLTLPLMSYGGCSLIAMLLAMGLLFRIDFESHLGKTRRVNF